MRLTDREILNTIKTHSDSRGLCTLSQTQIAELAECHRNTVRLSLRRLVAANKIEILGQKKVFRVLDVHP